MKMIPKHLYRYDCSAGGNGFFYGIYTHSDTYENDPSYWFDYVSSSAVTWESSDFCCSMTDSDKLTYIGPPSDFPEYFL